MSRKNAGMLVETKSGQIGRTFNSKERVNGKIAVYIAIEFTNIGTEDEPLKIPTKFQEQALLCEPSSLEVVGYLD